MNISAHDPFSKNSSFLFQNENLGGKNQIDEDITTRSQKTLHVVYIIIIIQIFSLVWAESSTT